jgi:hypothetical protein
LADILGSSDIKQSLSQLKQSLSKEQTEKVSDLHKKLMTGV